MDWLPMTFHPFRSLGNCFKAYNSYVFLYPILHHFTMTLPPQEIKITELMRILLAYFAIFKLMEPLQSRLDQPYQNNSCHYKNLSALCIIASLLSGCLFTCALTNACLRSKEIFLDMTPDPLCSIGFKSGSRELL